MEKEIARLDNIIWKTKGIRFLTAKRYELRDKWSNLTLTAVSIYIFALSIFIAVVPEAERYGKMSDTNLNYIIFFLSIVLIAFSLTVNSRSYALKASKFHDCSREINEVYNKLCLIKNDTKNTTNRYEIARITEEYDAILNKYDMNHSTIDYLKFQNNHVEKYTFYVYVNITITNIRFFFDSLFLYLCIIFTPLLYALAYIYTTAR